MPRGRSTVPVAESDQLLCGRNAYAAGGRYHMKSSFGKRTAAESRKRTCQSIGGLKNSYPKRFPWDVSVTDQSLVSLGVTRSVSPIPPTAREPRSVGSSEIGRAHV